MTDRENFMKTVSREVDGGTVTVEYRDPTPFTLPGGRIVVAPGAEVDAPESVEVVRADRPENYVTPQEVALMNVNTGGAGWRDILSEWQTSSGTLERVGEIVLRAVVAAVIGWSVVLLVAYLFGQSAFGKIGVWCIIVWFAVFALPD